jgi:hypothetical protein
MQEQEPVHPNPLSPTHRACVRALQGPMCQYSLFPRTEGRCRDRIVQGGGWAFGRDQAHPYRAPPLQCYQPLI